ncbi:MAG: ACT domain-containing protein [Anaerolineae bacterium]|nr:ACT domain-containing protein [Anaerolineae bacterium]
MSDLERALAGMRLYTDGIDYMIVHAPAAAVTAACGVLAETREPFGAVLVDKDEITLVLAAEVWANYQHRLPDHEAAGPFRLVTFDTPLSLDMVGFLAAVSRALADAGVPIMAFSAYTRDHLFVPTPQFETARATLEALAARAAGDAA